MRKEIILPSVPYAGLRINSAHEPSKVEWFCPMHYHNEIEILHIISGKKDCILTNKTVTGSMGDIIFINERVPHAVRAYTGCADAMLQFRTDNMSARYALGDNYNMALFLSNAQTDCMVIKKGSELSKKLEAIMSQIESEDENRQPSYELMIKGYLNILMGVLYRYEVLRPYEYSTKALLSISDIVRYVDENYKKNISLDNICKKFSVNKSYFCRQFKKATNRTFIEYLNFVRILEAQRLLGTDGENITDISLECGFAQTGYFNRVFKSITGCSPKSFRKIKNGEQDVREN